MMRAGSVGSRGSRAVVHQQDRNAIEFEFLIELAATHPPRKYASTSWRFTHLVASASLREIGIRSASASPCRAAVLDPPLTAQKRRLVVLDLEGVDIFAHQEDVALAGIDVRIMPSSIF